MRKTSARMRLALLALVISSPLIIIGQIHTVHAQTPITKVTGFSLDLLEVGYSNDKIWALATNGSQFTTANSWIYEVDPTDYSVDALYNVTTFRGQLAEDMWCSPIYCYVGSEGLTNSTVVQVATITGGGETKGDIINSATFNTVSETTIRMDGRYLTSGDVTTLFIAYKANANTQICMAQYEGLFLTLSQSICNTNASWNGDTNSDIRFFAPTVSEWHAFTTTIAGGGQGGLLLWDLYNNVIDCSSIAQTNGVVGSPNYQGTSTNPWLGYPPEQPTGTNGLIAIDSGVTNLGMVEFISRPACVEQNTYDITTADTGLASVALRTVQFSEDPTGSGTTDPTVGLAFFQESGANARISVVSWNGVTYQTSGTPTIYNTNPAVSQLATQGDFVIIPALELIMVPENGAGRAIVILDYSSLAPEPPTPPSDTNLPPESITDVIGGLLCTSGLIAPDQCDPDTGRPINGDAETNGSGLFLTWFLFIFTGGVMIGVSRKFTFSLTNIPAEFWLGLVVLIIGISWYLNWIPDIIFYGVIVGLAGLFAFGLYRSMGKGSDS